MMTPGMIADIISLGNEIYQVAQTVNANKAQCQQLAKRVHVITTTLQHLETFPKQRRFKEAATRLHQTLHESLQFVQTFSGRKWYQRVIHHGTDQEQFAALNTALQHCVGDLNLTLNTQQLFDQAQNIEDQAKDRQDIDAKQQEIMDLAHRSLEDLHQLQHDAQQRHHILSKQLASVRAQLAQIQVTQPSAPPIDKHLLVHFSDLTFEAPIGEGTFGRVYRGRWHEQVVAIKMVEDDGLGAAARQQFIREVKIMSRLRSPYVAQLYGASIETGRLCLLMEYFPRGALDTLIKTTVLTPEARHQMILDVVRGLHYLHSQNVAHHDVKTANVLVDERHRAKLTDFGVSYTAARSVRSARARSQSTAWMAPELLRRGAVADAASDIFSVGTLMWSILTGKEPFEKASGDLARRIIAGEREHLSDTIPAPYLPLIQSCWEASPQARPEALTLIKQLERIDITQQQRPTPEDLCEQGMRYDQKQDYTNAFQCYLSSAETGYCRAQTNVGTYYLFGRGMPINKPLAHNWFLKAANQGHARAQYNLAQMLEYGDGVPKDITGATRWYHQAARQGHAKAQQRYQKLTRAQEAGFLGRQPLSNAPGVDMPILRPKAGST